MKLQYDLIDESNIKLAISIQGVIFPEESAGEHYQYAISTNYCDCVYYIVKWNDIPVGVTGIYTMNMYVDNEMNDDTVWLGWYGILPEFRTKGIGRQTLLDTIEKAKTYKRKYFRLYTTDSEDALARPLYQKIMQVCEPYQNEQDCIENENCVIYSYSLNGENMELWNNRCAYISNDVRMSCIANQKLKDNYKILVVVDDNSEYFMIGVKLATSFRADGHLVVVSTLLNSLDTFDIIIREDVLLKADSFKNANNFFEEVKRKIYKSYEKDKII